MLIFARKFLVNDQEMIQQECRKIGVSHIPEEREIHGWLMEIQYRGLEKIHSRVWLPNSLIHFLLVPNELLLIATMGKAYRTLVPYPTGIRFILIATVPTSYRTPFQNPDASPLLATVPPNLPYALVPVPSEISQTINPVPVPPPVPVMMPLRGREYRFIG